VREVGLEDVPVAHIVDDARDLRLIVLAAAAVAPAQRGHGGAAGGMGCEEVPEGGGGAGVRRRDEGALVDDVDREERIVEGEVDLRHGPRGRPRRRQTLEQAARLIGQVADGTALKGRTAGDRLAVELIEESAQTVERRLLARHPVPRGGAVDDAEDAERIAGEVGPPPQPVMGHRAVEERQPLPTAEARGGLERVDERQFDEGHGRGRVLVKDGARRRKVVLSELSALSAPARGRRPPLLNPVEAGGHGDGLLHRASGG
jgi:hypothetical protein